MRQAIKLFGTLATILSDNGSCFVGVRQDSIPKGTWTQGGRKIFKDGRDMARLERAQQTEIKRIGSEKRTAMKTVETKEEKHMVKKEFAARKKAVKELYGSALGKIKDMRNSRCRTVYDIQKTDNEAKKNTVYHKPLKHWTAPCMLPVSL